MSEPSSTIWLPRLLFRLTLAISAALLGLVVLCPWLHRDGTSRLVTLFAHDTALRRTTVASAVGLAVTAFVFFRSPRGEPAAPPVVKKPRAPRPPPPRIAGA